MVIGVVTASISIPEARSLKDKRSVLRSLKDRIVHHMNVSAAEVGRQDEWQFSELAFVTVGANSEIVQSRVSEICQFLRSNPRYVLLNLHTQLL
ncbi:MAG: DUF503 domain-containing protein [Kiritimatiellia bacterium]